MAGTLVAASVVGVMDAQAAFPAEINLANLDGSNGFVITGADRGSGAGDVNGDGIDHVIMRNSNASRRRPLLPDGESYVVFGTKTGFPAAINLSDLDGSNGFVMKGTDSSYDGFAGLGVSGAGDVNADGFDDVIVGSPRTYREPPAMAGNSYVVFGNARLPAAMNLADLNGSNAFVIPGGL